MNKPYIGVTGFVNQSDVREVLSLFKNYKISKDKKHIPMIGILVSPKNLLYKVHPSRENQFPTLSNLPSLLEEAHGEAFTTVHYCKKSSYQLYEDITQIFEKSVERVPDGCKIYVKNLCEGLQLNIPWPDPEEIRKIREEYNKLKIILQLSSQEREGMTNDEVASKILKNYKDAEYILIDPSSGEGRPFDIDNSVDLYNRIKDKGINATIGLAGGLYGETVGPVLRKVKEKLGYTNPEDVDISIDAQGKLMGIDKKLSLILIDQYLKYASDAFNYCPIIS